MGAKQTKIDGEYLPQTPKQPQPITVETDFEDLDDVSDPRSPHICRTPLSEVVEAREVEVYQQMIAVPAISSDKPLGLLRKRFLKGFSYNLNDPRSPSVFLNRTPLIFDDGDKTLNLDDTFSDLFVESKIPRVDVLPAADPVVAEVTPQTPSEQPEETQAVDEAPPCETIDQRDPRSPSIGVDRTPIVFPDDAIPDEEDMIESILSTLSLNLKSENIPKNKPLERIKHKKRGPHHKVPYRRNKIYEDRVFQTPPKTQQKIVLDSPSNGTRTPLGCVKNHSQLRSKSVEVSGKSIKSRLPLTSFDDTLHKITPIKKILRYSNMENIENSFEF